MGLPKRRAVFLDRDGVINRARVWKGKPYPPANVGEVEILPGVASALTRLKKAGFVLLVVSNQPDVARGTTSLDAVEAINSYLAERLPLDRFYMCCHDSSAGCECRKPRPGMLLAGSRDFGIDLINSYMVGDRWRDVEAGITVGCKTIFIDYGYDEKRPESFDYNASSLLEAVTFILNGGIHHE